MSRGIAWFGVILQAARDCHFDGNQWNIRGESSPFGGLEWRMVDPLAARRKKVFRVGRPRTLDRNAKVRIMHWPAA
jgi:hypothetical protein